MLSPSTGAPMDVLTTSRTKANVAHAGPLAPLPLLKVHTAPVPTSSSSSLNNSLLTVSSSPSAAMVVTQPLPLNTLNPMVRCTRKPTNTPPAYPRRTVSANTLTTTPPVLRLLVILWSLPRTLMPSRRPSMRAPSLLLFRQTSPFSPHTLPVSLMMSPAVVPTSTTLSTLLVGALRTMLSSGSSETHGTPFGAKKVT